jgi:hypothetical protein
VRGILLLDETDEELVLDEIDEFTSERPSFRRKHLTALLVMATILVTAGFVAAVVAWTHTFPPTNVGPILTSACQNGSLIIKSPPTLGSIRYACTTAGPAFTSTANSPVTPAFNKALPIGWTLSSVATGAGVCSAGLAIVNGTAVSFPPADYDYCIIYAQVGSLSGFVITWNQPS